VAPTILSTAPANTEGGVRADAHIVVTFSEPMDAAATEAAFTSADLPPHTFAWDAAGRVLTVTPSMSLEYATATDATTPARQYTFAIGTGAADRAGNKLAQATSVTFATLRSFGAEILFDPTRTGYVSGNMDYTVDDPFVYTNCNSVRYGAETRIFLSFDLGALPMGIAEFAGAHLTLTPAMLDAKDTFPTAPLDVTRVHYDKLDATTFATAAGADLGALMSVNSRYVLDSTAMRDAVAGDYADPVSSGGRTQQRIRIAADTCEDRATFTRPLNDLEDSPRLSISYLMR
jgi:hypothetical protein